MTPRGGPRENSGRPTNEQKGKPVKITISFSVSPDDAEKIKQAAASLGLSQSEYMRQVIALSDALHDPIAAILKAQEAAKQAVAGKVTQAGDD